MKTLLLSRSDVAKAIDIDEVIEGVRQGYMDYQKQAVVHPDIVSVDMPDSKADCDIKSCYNARNKTYSVKIAALYTQNGKINDLPPMMGTVLLYDTTDGNVISIMDGGLITGVSTGAAGAISCDLLARKDAHTAAMFGGGGQARMQIQALTRVRDITKIQVYSQFPQELPIYKEEIERRYNILVMICETPAETMNGADIAISTTPTREFMADASLVRPGMHIVAVGADEAGKNEWDPKIFGMADKIVCDNTQQCLQRGETRNAVVNGIICEMDIYAEIGEILLETKVGRTSDDEITIYDTIGMGVQDNVTALKIYETAKAGRYGTEFEFI